MRFSTYFPCILAWLLLSHPGVSQSAASGALAQAARLEAEKKYESAYHVLDKADPKDEQPEVFLQKEKLLLQYYLIALNFQAFGLKDLKASETVEQLRGKEGNYNMHLLDIPQKLKQLQKRFPQDYRLHKGMGDYYMQSILCGCAVADKTEAERLKLVVDNYSHAHAHKLGDFMSYYAMGYAHLVQQQAPASVTFFEQSIALNAEYPTSHYNLAYALLELQKPAEAIPHAQAAFRLYALPELKADAARMLGQLYGVKQAAESRKALLQSLELQPQSYASLRSLMALAVATKAPDAAAWAAKLYQLNPADDQMFVDIMDSYQAQGQWAEAETFFSSQVPKAPAQPAAQGLLHFYLAILNMQLQRPQTARPHFLAAQTQLRKVAKPDNPMFEVISRGLAESRSN